MENPPEQSSAPFPWLLQQLVPGQDSPGFGAANWNFHENAEDFCGFPAFFPRFMDSPIHHVGEQPPLPADGELWQKEVVPLSSKRFSWNIFPFFLAENVSFGCALGKVFIPGILLSPQPVVG